MRGEMRYGLPIAIASALLAAGCMEECRLPPPSAADELRRACCVFLRHEDDRVLGGGVFVSKKILGRRRVFCLTARHVATEWEYDSVKRAPYMNPAGIKIAVLGDGGVKAKAMLVAPERWQSADLSHDLAWFGLAEEEWSGLSASAVAVGETVGEGILESEGNGVLCGTAAVRLKEYGPAGISYGSDLAMLLPERKADSPDPLAGTGATTNVLATLHGADLLPVNMTFKRNFQLKELPTKQLVARAKIVCGDSGAPVFAMGCVGKGRYPLLAGVVTAKKDDFDGRGTPGASVCPLDEALLFLGASSAHRLVDHPEYQ